MIAYAADRVDEKTHLQQDWFTNWWPNAGVKFCYSRFVVCPGPQREAADTIRALPKTLKTPQF